MKDNNSYPTQPDKPSFTPNYSTVPLYGQAEREAWMAEGAKRERAAITSWLRAHKDEHGQPSVIAGQFADAIERGEHMEGSDG